MASEKFLCVLAGYDEETDAHLQSLQQRLYAAGFSGTQTRGIPMHATLGYAACEDEAAMLEVMHSAAQAAPFDVTFNHIGIFGGGKVMFVAPDVSHALLFLKEHFGGSDNWTAHTTMLIDEPNVICDAATHLLREFSAFRGRIDRLHLYEFQPPRHIATVMLGGIRKEN